MDTIGDMITMMKNASRASHEVVVFPHSKVKEAILACLKENGYIKSFSKKTRKTFPVLEVELIYKDDMPKITEVKRISKPSRRMYAGVNDFKPVKNGYGLTILSTPKGIMTQKDAKKEQVGGEILFAIW